MKASFTIEKLQEKLYNWQYVLNNPGIYTVLGMEDQVRLISFGKEVGVNHIIVPHVLWKDFNGELEIADSSWQNVIWHFLRIKGNVIISFD